jgi:hypothetical protein
MGLSTFIRLYDKIALLFFIISRTLSLILKMVDLSGYIFIRFLSFLTMFINLKPKNENPVSVQFIDVLDSLIESPMSDNQLEISVFMSYKVFRSLCIMTKSSAYRITPSFCYSVVLFQN